MRTQYSACIYRISFKSSTAPAASSPTQRSTTAPARQQQRERIVNPATDVHVVRRMNFNGLRTAIVLQVCVKA